MNAIVMYDTNYGNTGQLAQKIADTLSEQMNVTLLRASEANEPDLKADLVVMGGPTHGHGLSATMRALLERIPVGQLEGIPVAAFDTRMRWPQWLSGSAAHNISKKLQELGGRPVIAPKSFFVEGGEGPLSEGEIQYAADWARTLLEVVAPYSTAPR